MTFWELLDRRAERSHALRIARAAHPPVPLWHWPDARGWIGISLVALTVMLLWMIKADPELRKDEFFKTIAVLIIGTGFINGVVSWAYAATKQGGELADRAANTVMPTKDERPSPKDAEEAADRTADAAADEADTIRGERT